jgi:hypothetical protein
MNAKRTRETHPPEPERKREPAPAHDPLAPQSWGAPRDAPTPEPTGTKPPMHVRFPKTWATNAWSPGAWADGAWSDGAFK